MIELFYILWNVDPEIISGFPPRWYGLLFALGFVVGSSIMTRIYKLDGRNPDEVERLTIYMLIATIVGARLGHCLFYDPVYYLSNPLYKNRSKRFKLTNPTITNQGLYLKLI